MCRTSCSSWGRFSHKSSSPSSSPTSPVEVMQKLLNVHNSSWSSAQCPLLSGLQRWNEKRLMLQAWKCLCELYRKGACRLEITYRHLHTLSYASDNSIAEDQIHTDSFPQGRKTYSSVCLFFYFPVLSPAFLSFLKSSSRGLLRSSSLSSSPFLWLGWRLMGADMMVALSSPSVNVTPGDAVPACLAWWQRMQTASSWKIGRRKKGMRGKQLCMEVDWELQNHKRCFYKKNRRELNAQRGLWGLKTTWTLTLMSTLLLNSVWYI